jgi:hypothetical protein
MVKPKDTRLSDKSDLPRPVFLPALSPFYLKIRAVSPKLKNQVTPKALLANEKIELKGRKMRI